MTTEEKLKDFILTKYRSLRQFTQEIGLPYSTMTTLLKKGVNNSNVQTVIKICKALNISADKLAAGKISPLENNADAIKIEAAEGIKTIKSRIKCSDHRRSEAADNIF